MGKMVYPKDLINRNSYGGFSSLQNLEAEKGLHVRARSIPVPRYLPDPKIYVVKPIN